MDHAHPHRAPLLIRDLRADDADARDALITRAFADTPHASGTEAAIAAALDTHGIASVSLLVERDGVPVGCVQTSPVSLSDGTTGWHGLGPIAVDPACQRDGIGTALMTAALERLRSLGASGCVLLGDPAYYTRFGFAADPRLVLPGVPPTYFLRLAFGDVVPSAKVRYDAVFEAG
nr:N-acetyltransferase [Luteimonas sp. 9C]